MMDNGSMDSAMAKENCWQQMEHIMKDIGSTIFPISKAFLLMKTRRFTKVVSKMEWPMVMEFSILRME